MRGGGDERRRELSGHLPGLCLVHAALRYACRCGMPALAKRTLALAARLRESVRVLDRFRILDRGPQLGALVTFTVAGWTPEPLKAELVGHGIHCSVALREHAQFDPPTTPSTGAYVCPRTTATPTTRWTASLTC